MRSLLRFKGRLFNLLNILSRQNNSVVSHTDASKSDTMRLINVDSYKVEEFLPQSIPLYAILSHTWEDGEVSFQDIQQLDRAKSKGGFLKIEYCCRQAKLDGLSWVWVDTCCIDKTSSAELSEAINSMFLWYSVSEICYAYLGDVTTPEDLQGKMATEPYQQEWKPPRWFTRGWTLQELIAPSTLVFYSADWQPLGSRDDYQDIISRVTGIHRRILNGSTPLDEIPVATRMSWASKRSTTRKEDEAYCLLGIFDVHMPLLYGEGERAFQRLQEEILKTTEDQTIFLWHSERVLDPRKFKGGIPAFFERGFLAKSPHDFESCSMFRPVLSALDPNAGVSSRERGIRLDVRLTELKNYDRLRACISKIQGQSFSKDPVCLAALNCTVDAGSEESRDLADKSLTAIFLKPVSVAGEKGSVFTRFGYWHVLIPKEETETWEFSTCYIRNPKIDDFNPGNLRWKTPRFGYGGNYALNFVDVYDSIPSSEFGDVVDTPDRAYAALLDQSGSLPWLVVTVGLGSSDGMIFCDIWKIPQSMVAKVMAVEGKGITEPRHRVRILSEVRVREMYALENGPRWRHYRRNHGLLIRASCWINYTLEATVSIMGDAIDVVYMSIRERRRRFGEHDCHEMSEERIEEIWSHVEESIIPYVDDY